MQPVAPPVEGRRWLTSTPVTPDHFAGRVVLVVFWSFGCEASIRTVEQAQALTEDWSDRVAAIAVHSPRFPFEDDEKRLEAAIVRHHIEIPVLHDPDYLTWNRYGPAGWPATAVVDRAGRLVGMTGGNEGFEIVAEAAAAELSRPQGRRDRDRARRTDRASSSRSVPLVSALPAASDQSSDWLDGLTSLQVESTLWFPSAVALSPSGLLSVADTGNDRILIGALDADYRTFRPEVEITSIERPTAVAFGSDTIVYAIERDTRSVLQIDLASGTVDVVADEELSIPTALIVDRDGSLVVADAGLDQLIRIVGGEEADVIIGPIAGRGVTGCLDGPAAKAELAQPVALVRTDRGIAFCDAASSNIRMLTDDGQVVTITGNEFFDWGLVDGPAHRARLQRPGGLAVTHDGALVVADTGNDRIRILADRQIRTLGLAGLDQPTGVAVLPGGHLLVADAAQHRLVVANPAGRSAWPVAVYPAVMTSVWDDDLVIEGADEPAEDGAHQPGSES